MTADIQGRLGKGAIPRTGFRELGPLVAGRLRVGESCRSVCHFSLSPLRTKEVRIRLGGFHLLCVAPPRSLIGFLPTHALRGVVPQYLVALEIWPLSVFLPRARHRACVGWRAEGGQEHRSVRSR